GPRPAGLPRHHRSAPSQPRPRMADVGRVPFLRLPAVAGCLRRVGLHDQVLPRRRRERRRRGDPRVLGPGPPLRGLGFLVHSWPAPCRASHEGGFAACPPPLRSGGLLLPPGSPPHANRGPMGPRSRFVPVGRYSAGAIDTIGLLSLIEPVDPKNGASPKAKMPPSVATIQ